jgi:hypothetical protein
LVINVIRKRYLALRLTGLLAITCAWPAAAATDYRLTGIIGSDGGMAFAVIESADGHQQLVQEGGSIGPGYVKRISAGDKTVVLAMPTGELSLRLTGSATPGEAREEFSMSDFYGDTTQQALDPAAIAGIQALAGDSEKLTDKQIALQLNKLLGLSDEAQVAAYDDQQVDSARALLKQLGKQISSQAGQGNFLGRIAVSDEQGQRRIYLTTDDGAD